MDLCDLLTMHVLLLHLHGRGKIYKTIRFDESRMIEFFFDRLTNQQFFLKDRLIKFITNKKPP